MSEETTGNQQETTKKSSGGSFFKLLIVIVIIAIIAIGGYFMMNQGVNEAVAVAVVNGEEITRSVYDARFAQLAASITSQGQSATTTEMQEAIKNQVLEDLVVETILLQSAQEEGITEDGEEVNTSLIQSKSQFADEAAFQAALTAQGFTETTFKEYLKRANVIQKYLLAKVDVSSAVATEEEVQALYDQAVVSDSSIPPLEEVRAQVENQIVQQKQQQLIASFIQELRASSSVETLI